MLEKEKNLKLLLHICCAGCGAYVSQVLKEESYDISLFFYNPNLYPASEYFKRQKEAERIAKEFGLDFLTLDRDHEAWLKKIKDLEREPEKGKRCLVCYRDRLEITAQKAKKQNFDLFSSTLTVSPHKLALEINKIGLDLAEQYNIKFLDRDFKKKDGFKKASALSKELNLYRQNYCGCEFSI